MSHTFTITPASAYINSERCYHLHLQKEGHEVVTITQTINKTRASIARLVEKNYRWHWSEAISPDTCEIIPDQEVSRVNFTYPSQVMSEAHSWGSLYTLFAPSMGLPDASKHNHHITFVTNSAQQFIEQFNNVTTRQIKT